MNGTTGSAVRLTLVVVLSLLAVTAGAATARAAASCGLVTAAGRTWIVVANGVPCPTANRVTRAFAARTAALRSGRRVTVTTPLLHGFTCVLASHGKPGGSCATAGAARSVLWIAAS